jgi:DNA-binding transcriptional LysR family regulator
MQRVPSYVLAICETGSFTKAAERIGVKQPSLSLLIKRLERELGIQLFEREQGLPVRMTPAGRALLPELRRFCRIGGCAEEQGQPDRLERAKARSVDEPACSAVRL